MCARGRALHLGPMLFWNMPHGERTAEIGIWSASDARRLATRPESTAELGRLRAALGQRGQHPNACAAALLALLRKCGDASDTRRALTCSKLFYLRRIWPSSVRLEAVTARPLSAIAEAPSPQQGWTQGLFFLCL